MGSESSFHSALSEESNSVDHATKGADNTTTITEFKHFDVVPEASDHHYLISSKAKQFNEGKPVYAKIMREWKILEKNLPETIYVQVYETRIDLLRALIIGPQGTPYHDCLFFFDILLPYDYPNNPPKVHYHSYGYRLNPNLYATGYVCLSLINTWSGTIAEKWTNKSTILQILVSIQGLVLNEKPYFNEPGYADKINSPSYVNASVKYNEEAFIMSCKTLLHIIRKRPVNFEVFVEQHVRARGLLLLASIKNYLETYVPVGPTFKSKLSIINKDLEIAFAFVSSEPKMEIIRKKNVQGEEGSASTSTNIGEQAGKGRKSKEVKNQEKVKKHKNGIFKNFFKCLSK